MLDNGATVNLIKLQRVSPEVEIFGGRSIELEGISPDPQPTLGEAAVISYHYNSIVVRSDPLNPIPFLEGQESPSKRIGIVTRNATGVPSLSYVAPPTVNAYKDYCADREFVADCDELCSQSRKQQALPPSNGPTKQKIQVPARTRAIVQLKLITTALRDGYLPRIDTGNPDVFLGEGLVRNEGNTCKVLAINSGNNDVEFEVDPAEIIPFEYVVQDFESDSPSAVEDRPVLNAEQRNSRIREALDLNPLNPEEKASVLALIRDYPELFLLPGDPLPCTNLVYHEIPLENEIPINTKQYRHPPVHKEVIQKDIDKRLREGITISEPYELPNMDRTEETGPRWHP
ncbi:hypothetical protein TKK_0014611 [Trichogramma kaykai]